MQTNPWALPKPIIALAPMEGVTEMPFRVMCKRQGADLIFSEVVHTDKIINATDKCYTSLHFSPAERPYIVQIKGNHPAHFKKAINIIVKRYRPDGIDINFGCPARKVVNAMNCAALLKEPELAKRLIATAVEASSVPVSVKTRIGIENVRIMDFLREININSLGIAGFTLHGRSKEMGHSGRIDTRTMAEVKAYLNVPFLANGGINNKADVRRVMRETNADGIMIARGALGNPWIFKNAHQFTDETVTDYIPNWDERKKVMIAHARLAEDFKGETGIIELRKHLASYTKGFAGAKNIRLQLMRAKNAKQVAQLLHSMGKQRVHVADSLAQLVTRQ